MKGEKWIDSAAHKAVLKWKAGEQLRRKLLSEGADARETRKYLDRLATALREG